MAATCSVPPAFGWAGGCGVGVTLAAMTAVAVGADAGGTVAGGDVAGTVGALAGPQAARAVAATASIRSSPRRLTLDGKPDPFSTIDAFPRLPTD
jgi:hypothetical protein